MATLSQELLHRGHEVVGVDNLSKYGPVARSYDHAEDFQFVEGDARDVGSVTRRPARLRSPHRRRRDDRWDLYFHTYAYDLLATNERIMAATCDAAIEAHRRHRLQKVTYLVRRWSSSRPTSGHHTKGKSARFLPRRRRTASRSSPSSTSPGRAYDQYGLPYTIVRPFNCVGIGEGRALGDRKS